MAVIDARTGRGVLVVDGDSVTLSMIQSLLERERLGKAMPIDLGEDAIELMALYSDRIYAIVIDLGLPDMSGFDVLRKVAVGLSEPVCVIAMTSMRTQIVKSRFNALMRRSDFFCATDFIVKPFHQDRLLSSLHNGLEKVHFHRKYWLDRM